ncbi:MAG: putative methylase, partial [Gemmatimonadales bacterium]|nr:putative methylase [Gemmatimonadales bacterium]
ADEIKGAVALPEGSRPYRIDNLTSQSGVDKTRFPVMVDGVEYTPRKGVWKTGKEGMARLLEDRRLQGSGKTLSYVRYLDDFNARPLSNLWDDTIQSGFGAEKQYVVQTNPRVIARCVLMTTDPGDLVLDPTCGSGTTAQVAEQYGRRWITVDTSRVALAIARERLLTSRFDYYALVDSSRGIDGGLKYKNLQRLTLRSIARGEDPEHVVLYDEPLSVKGKVRVTGPFTVEALSRYAVNPSDDISAPDPSTTDTTEHVHVLLNALKSQGIPRPGEQPATIESLTPLAAAGSLQAEGVVVLGGKQRRFAVALGPQFGAITMAQVSDALREAIGFDLVVFAGFAVSADAQAKLAIGKLGGTQVALLLANLDLLVGDLLKNTKSSQTFRLYSAPDVKIGQDGDGFRVSVEGVDTFDASTGNVVSYGTTGIQAWFLDTDYDGTVFRVTQAFFPVTDAWKKLQTALRGTVDAELLDELHGWTSLPFASGDYGRVAVRVIAQDGNAAEVILPLTGAVV